MACRIGGLSVVGYCFLFYIRIRRLPMIFHFKFESTVRGDFFNTDTVGTGTHLSYFL